MRWNRYYIRIGELPESGYSCIYDGDRIVGYEAGISVYRAVNFCGMWHICMPYPFRTGQGGTYENLLREVSLYRNVYLVKGDEVGLGSDNEPLLRNVVIVANLTDYFIDYAGIRS